MNQGATGNLPRLLVIGARGFLGSFLAERARRHYQVIRADRTLTDAQTDVAIDVTDRATISRAFAEIRPDHVILLAAISDIDRCQRDPAQAVAVNQHGAEYVANACARSGARLLFTSTGAVFNGYQHGYKESDPVSPLSIYGETKAEAERIVTALVPASVVLRVSLILGATGRQGTNSLVDTMLRRWQAGEVISASTLESRNPVDASTLSQWMLELLANRRQSGIFHTGATDSMTRYALAASLAHRLHINPALIRPESQPPPGRAPRGADHFLLTTKISRVCTTQPPSCQQVIEECLNEVAEGSLRAGV